MGDQDQPRGDQVGRPADGHQDGDGEADARRARPPRRDPHGRRREAVADPHGRGRQAGGGATTAPSRRERRGAASRDPARRGRSEGDRHGLQSDPRGQTEPRAVELRIPADASPARRRRREQGVRGAVRVRPGVRRHRRGDDRAQSGDGPPNARPPAPPARPRPALRAAPPPLPGGDADAGGARTSAERGGCENRRSMFDSLAEKLQRNALRCAQPRHAHRAGHRRGDARDPPRAARGGRQLQGRQAVHRRS